MPPANQQTDARSAWTSVYPFEPYNGGQGVSLAAGTVSSSVTLLGMFGQPQNVNVAVVFNTGSVFAFVRFGGSTVTADTGSMAVPPGGAITVSLYGVNQQTPSHMAAITASGSATLQITTGFGN